GTPLIQARPSQRRTERGAERRGDRVGQAARGPGLPAGARGPGRVQEGQRRRQVLRRRTPPCKGPLLTPTAVKGPLLNAEAESALGPAEAAAAERWGQVRAGAAER